MDELEQIELDIKEHKKSLVENIIKVGKRQLGVGATLKQICNYVAPQFGLSPADVMRMALQVRGSDNEFRND